MRTDFIAAIRPAFVITLLLAIVTGLIYPVVITAIGQTVFPGAANGSLIRDGGAVRGSALIGQSFAAPGYFHGRPSAAGKGYDALASAGSNLGPTSQALHDRVSADLASLHAGSKAPVPADLVTASGSGLDPHISPAAALYQAPRIAVARHLPLDRVRALVARQTEQPVAGIIGEERVNVLLLNRALDGEPALP